MALTVQVCCGHAVGGEGGGDGDISDGSYGTWCNHKLPPMRCQFEPFFLVRQELAEDPSGLVQTIRELLLAKSHQDIRVSRRSRDERWTRFSVDNYVFCHQN